MSNVSVGAVCTGKVAWFNTNKGYGFISFGNEKDKDIFVHYSGILTSGYKTLRDGDDVEFTISEGSGGRLQASQVTVIGRSNGSNNVSQHRKDQKKKR